MLSHKETLSTLQQRIRKGDASLVEIVDAYLARIECRPELNAFLEVFSDEARAEARRIEARLRNDQAGPLAGMVLAVKDNIAIKGKRLTCGSRILQNFVSPYDATVIQRLRAADALFIGKTNMDEFAMGSSNENSAFGPVAHPGDPQRVPGGSSGGSAAAVAANLCWAALGSDTGGSIRQPAAFCGVIGLKPTYGRVSRFGLVAFASSLDQIGPITRSVEDAARLLQVMAGPDERDSTTVTAPVPDLVAALDLPPNSLRVGIPKQYLGEGIESDILEALGRAQLLFSEAGFALVDLDLPLTEYNIAAYYVICTAEASSNLARYDGVRYGYRAPEAHDLESMYVKTRSQGFGEEVKRRIMLGTYVLSSGYYDAYYRRALKVRTLIRREFAAAFEQCDVILTPTTPTTAFRMGERLDDPLAMYLSDVFTVSANLAGLPAISIAAGRDRQGLPIGLQLMAKPFDEVTLLQAARFLETRLEI